MQQNQGYIGLTAPVLLRPHPTQRINCPWRPVARQPLPNTPLSGVVYPMQATYLGQSSVQNLGKTVAGRITMPARDTISLGRLWGFAGLFQITMGLSVICDFCGSPQTHNWQRIWCYIGLTALSLTEWHPPNPQITGGKFPGNLVPSCAFLATQIQQ